MVILGTNVRFRGMKKFCFFVCVVRCSRREI